ncbi:MAG TPA: class I SAM-dependent methyltransferase [Pyrinomonadaceae bacterium]|jgi:SAM-dependent methyltransferase|nr:class I SAM-dependent methyltransferase [Pyrinomonadaceae bacterium]
MLFKTKEQPEISDEIVAYDPSTLARVGVRKTEVERHFESVGNTRAVRIVRSIPEREGFLDPEAVDRLLVAVHCEMQSMSEEFQHGRRVLEILTPLLDAFESEGPNVTTGRRLRVVDLGCGTGYVVRWLAARGNLSQRAELIGADYNAALVAEARRLAGEEKLECSFVVANAFRLAEPADVILSTGVVHHFRGRALTELFRQHEASPARAFVHFDFQPSPIAPLGSWLFHRVRMRQPLARHDGVLSAVRAHTGDELRAAAREGAPTFRASVYSNRLWGTPVPRAFHALVGARSSLWGGFVNALGRRASRLEERDGGAGSAAS